MHLPSENRLTMQRIPVEALQRVTVNVSDLTIGVLLWLLTRFLIETIFTLHQLSSFFK